AAELVEAGARGGREVENALDPLVGDGKRREIRAEVDLVEHYDLPTLVESGAVRGELSVDGVPARVGVALRRVDDVDEQAGTLEVREELVAEPDAFARALDEPGDVGDDELATVGG